MKLLSSLSIRGKFLLLPTIATILTLMLGAIFLNTLKNENSMMGQIANQDVPKMRELSRLFSEFSTNHVKFINLLASSLKKEIEEGEFYIQGRTNINTAQKILTELDQLVATYTLDENQQYIAGKLRQRLADYLKQMRNTIVMSSVDLILIAQLTLQANEAYDAANNEFLSLNDAMQLTTQDLIGDAQSSLRHSELQFLIILGATILLVVFISILLADVFSYDLKSIITILTKLAGGDTRVPETSEERKDEFGAVNRAIQVFRQTLIQRNEVEDQLKAEIRERTQIGRALRNSEERFKTLYEDNPLILITVDEDGTVLSINKRGARQIGFCAEELVGSSILDLVMEDDKQDAMGMIERCVSSPGIRHQRTLRKSHKNGNIIWLRETAQAINDDKRPMILLACEDITETHELSEKLAYQAKHDDLTGLVNRWEFKNRLMRVLATAKKNQSEHTLCYFDLDQFKIINDTCGHGAGDELLKQLAVVLQEKIRTRDTIARLGGDEFGILLEHCSMSVGWKTANALLKTIQEFRFVWEDRHFHIGASIGLLAINELSSDVTEILADADAACYTAKDEGRNRIHIYAEDDQQLAQRRGEIQWASRIPEALEDNDFELFYQTIAAISGNTGGGLHFELLIRLKDKKGNWVLPGQFLPAVERYDLSIKLDQWVIVNALAGLRRMKNQNIKVEQCAINLSGNSLGDKGFLEFVLKEIKHSQINPQSLCFEITETAAISNLSSAKKFINTLKSEGTRFALDDFGTGLSSFAYLKELPVDLLKIDGIFIRDLVGDPIQLAMVKSINDVGHVMGMKTVAEFVEDQEIMDLLKEIGVDYAQGYHISKPRPATEIFPLDDDAAA